MNEPWYEQGRMLAAILELSMRAGTGARMTRVNVIHLCRDEYGTKGRTNRDVLREMLAKWEETYGERFEMERAYENAGLPTVGQES